jgi:hypothetical protein
MSVCVSPKCATNINLPRRCRTMGFYLAVSHPVVLDVTMVLDDSNLLYSDISRGDEFKPNWFASTKLGEKTANFMLIRVLVDRKVTFKWILS